MTIPSRAPRLIIPADILTAIRAAVAEAYPNEGCGLLVGVEEPGDEAGKEGPALRVTRLILGANRHPEPRKNFEFDPAVLISVLRELREAERAGTGSGECLLGHVHSHPDEAARPSAQDLAMAYELGQVWLIVSVKNGRAGSPHAFQAVGKGPETVRFRVLRTEVSDRAGDTLPRRQTSKESP